MRKPDFFIVGAPKCGTTAMHHYLRQHPDIFMPARKESHFFGTDLTSPSFIRDEAVYLSLFNESRNEKKAGEASIWYLYSVRAAREISDFNPASAIIIMLRNPVDMIYSLHSQRLYSGNEDIEDFEVALAVEEDRKKGQRLPPHASPVEGLFYREVARYSLQVERYLATFGCENVHVIIYEEFKNDPARSYRELCRFLEVDPDFQLKFDVINPNKRVRSRTLRKWLRSPPEFTRTAGRILLPPHLRIRFAKGLQRFNTKYEQRPALAPGLRRRLQADFAPDIAGLGKLLGRDFAVWLE